MKRYANIVLLSILIVAAGCIEEKLLDPKATESEIGQLVPGKEITIQATRKGGLDADTKTTRVPSSGAVLWTPGDAISLFYGSGTAGGSRFESNATENTDVTNFTGTITAITGGANIDPADTYFWGVYPYRDDTSCDGTSITMTLPSQQTAVPGTFATDVFPSIGRSQGLVMGFYNVCGGWWFSVTKEGVRKVTIKSNGGEAIAGTVKVALNSSGIPQVTEIVDGSDEVVLECPRGEYFEVGENYYVVLLPGVLPGGFTMTFETYTEVGVYNRTKSTTITRSNFSGIPSLDTYLTTPYALKTGNIPIEDANFKAYLVTSFDMNGDGEISFEEAAAITAISTPTTEIASVQGIEFMTCLTSLDIRNNLGSYSVITNPDGSFTINTSTPRGRIESLDITNNLALENLNCSYNQIATINVSNNTELTSLNCSLNQLATLDMSLNTSLTYLVCGYNQLTTLDVSNNSALTNLSCDYNQLTTLDVSNNPALTNLSCWSNQLSTLDVSHNTALTFLGCDSNQLTSLDVSNKTKLKWLYCFDNQLTSLDASGCITLIQLNCQKNQLSSVDITNCLALTELNCEDNQLTTLDVSHDTALTDFRCSNNQLTSLDVSHNTALTRLECHLNRLTSLDVSQNTALTYLSCSHNQLSSLDVSNSAGLTQLYCYVNQLSSLDVSNNVSLTRLFCSNNQLTSLDVSHNTSLTELYCYSNQLTTLDISKNTTLTSLDCRSNLFTTLDVSNNLSLTSLYCSPMSTLETLLIAQGQEIPNITSNRSENNIPAGTQIVVAPISGGSEGTGQSTEQP